jgi:hypothetical protein
MHSLTDTYISQHMKKATLSMHLRGSADMKFEAPSKARRLNPVATRRLPQRFQFHDLRNTQGIYGHLKCICSKSWSFLCRKHTSFGYILILP